MDRQDRERRNREAQAMLDRVRPMLVKLVSARFTLAEDALTRDELWEVANDAVKDAVLTFDPAKAKWSTYAHYKADWAMLNAIEKQISRAQIPAVQALKAVYEHACRMDKRGDAMADTDARTLAHLEDALDELAGVFGGRLAGSPEEETERREIAREVHAALGEMSGYFAGIVRGRHLEEQTQEQTGRALGVSAAEICRDEPPALRQLQAILRRRGLGRRERDGDPKPGIAPGTREAESRVPKPASCC